MSDQFLRSTPTIDQIVIDATTGKNAGYETMRAALRAQLQRDGVIAHDRDSELGTRLLTSPREPMPEVALPTNPATDTCVRVVYPGGNNRFEIYGASEQALDEKERQIRAMFGGQR